MKYLLAICITLFLSCKNEMESKTENDTNPTPLEELKLKKGKKLFSNNCMACHSNNMYQRMTAPALGGVTLRRDKEWLYNYTRNSIKMHENGDSIAVRLRIENGNLLMPTFNFTDKDLDAVYFYIEKKYAERNE